MTRELTELRLADQHGRVANDLRVSLTDRCNLRCSYCMPADGLPWIRNDSILTDDEVIRLVTIAVTRLGVVDIRFTGGEPLLRRGLPAIIAACAGLRGPGDRQPGLSLTTNALGLDKQAAALAAAGLQRINISLDTLDAERFTAITRRARLQDVLAGIDAAAACGFAPIKLNAVPQPETVADDAPALLEYALGRGFELRFIEHMPLGPPGSWDRSSMATADDVRTALTDAGFRIGSPIPRGHAPAQTYAVSKPGLPDGTVGMIASVTAQFCADCTRTRLTADGQVRSCLFASDETDLRTALRAGADDTEVAQLWQHAMWRKPKAHGIDDDGFARPGRTMSAIGG